LFAVVALIAIPACAQFETRSSSSVLTSPVSIAVADFNKDHKLDAAVANFTGQLAILFGNGNGTFQPPLYYSVDYLESIAAADFRNDGNIDLAMVDGLNQYVTVLLNNGDGTFGSPSTVPLNGVPVFVAIGDFNGDHIPDLVAVQYIPTFTISVMLGNGDGTFQSPVDTGSPVSYPAIGLGDFNRDGKLDVAVAGDENGQLTILLGNGNGTFTTGATYSAGTFPTYVSVGDLTGDGILDIVVTSGGGLRVLLGNGDGTFRAGATYFTSGGGTQTADLNGDGKLDLVLLTETQPSPWDRVTVMLGNGDGTFQPPAYYQQFQEGTFIAVGDFNGDHKPDLAVAVKLGNAVGVLLNTGVVSFSPTTPLSFHAQFVGTTSAPQNVTLTNTGTATLSISSISVNKPFLLGSKTTCGTSVATGAKCTLSVIFQPTVMGLKTGLLVLNDSASSKPQVIELSGTGTVLTVSPSQLNFGSQKVGTKSPPQNVTVTNTGSTAVSVTGVSIAGSNYLDFSETNTCGSQINPGATCTISVTFAPITTGTRTAVAQINGPGGVVWQTVSLTGTGT
jgi:large repetitive protein